MKFMETKNGMVAIDDSCPLRRWSITKIDKFNQSFLFIWDPSPPLGGAISSISIPYENIVRLRLSRYYKNESKPKEEINFERLWGSLIFEIFNLENRDDLLVLYYRAQKGEITKEDFITQMVRLDYKALSNTVNFVEEQWLPWAMSVESLSIPSWDLWQYYDKNFQKWLAQYDPNEYYPWKAYGNYFDYLKVRGSKPVDASSVWRKELLQKYQELSSLRADNDGDERLTGQELQKILIKKQNSEDTEQ